MDLNADFNTDFSPSSRFAASGFSTLSGLGYDAFFSSSLEEGLTPGRVVRADRGGCTVLSLEGSRQEAYRLPRGQRPCVGDWVGVGSDGVRQVLPRRTAIVRGAAAPGVSSGQVLAANVDIVYIAEPAVPEIDLGRIERLLALAWESGARPVVLITKADLAGTVLAESELDLVARAAPGADVVAVSTVAGTGLDGLRPGPGETAVVLGRSGAGKSTLVNALAGREAMATGEVRAADGRGRHTTVHRELLLLPGGGLVIDTPGLRSIALHADGAGVARTFADVADLADACRFTDCAHESEPGCAVLAAVADGALPERRLASWRKLQREAEWAASRTDARLRAERERQWKIIQRSVRGHSRP
ncbi:ribosome small subunit-dependent GTPase A [Actinocorallia sp. API 0066]|uniref:ribosome small subunit-dependent GTPase A n=1 Tax=Actinocorallia sp. API 0066 TaxID=2896846 RepID=UPI001E60F69D|nr:ribosome small subunit-dependent GTPase A [Actinocorallia sp. API 0066]MCD0448569.1 ribosome small subunit-dependent GTPase A [Actinocorallia sp. API 0066]